MQKYAVHIVELWKIPQEQTTFGPEECAVYVASDADARIADLQQRCRHMETIVAGHGKELAVARDLNAKAMYLASLVAGDGGSSVPRYRRIAQEILRQSESD
jgi:hypothetical protein